MLYSIWLSLILNWFKVMRWVFSFKVENTPCKQEGASCCKFQLLVASCPVQSGLHSHTGVNGQLFLPKHTTFLKQLHRFSIVGDVYDLTKSLFSCFCPRLSCLGLFQSKANGSFPGQSRKDMISTLTERRFEQKWALSFSRQSKTKIVTLKIGAVDANISPNMSCPKIFIWS